MSPSKKASLFAAWFVASAGCAIAAPAGAPPDNDYWWPNRLHLEPLRYADASADPIGPGYHTPMRSRRSTWPRSRRTSAS
jgi:catalase-peroxidase